MAGPWEQYQQAPAAEAGPWTQYQTASSGGIPGPRQELTTGQKVYQTVRDIAAPTVEALGAAGGGLVGGGAGLLGGGPLGAAVGGIGGTGLGYGLAKGLIKQADVLMGVTPQETASQALARGAQNVLEGATWETGGKLLGPAIGYVGGKIADMRRIPQNEAVRIAKNALGPDLPQVLNALRAAPEGTTAAQATANINSPTWQALIQRATERDPRFLRALEQSQGDVSLNALARLAGGTTAAETRGTLEQAKAALNSMTGPQREAALNRANLGKSVADFEAQAGQLGAEAAAEVQKVRDLIKAGNASEAWARLDLIKRNLPVGATKYTHFGELADKAFNEWSSKAAQASLDLGQGAKFAQGAADALRSVGIKPLEGGQLSANIRAVTNNPSFAGNDLLEGAVKNVADDIARWTDSGGVIDARALEAIRKNSVNAAIAKLRPGADATTQRNLAAGVMSNLKPMIDNAIENAGGAGWREYLAAHSKGMAKIAEKKLAGEALQLWKANKDEFVRLVQNESPDVVEKILGPGKYNIATELADDTMQTLREQAKKHLTELSIKEQAGGGQEALRQIMLQQMPKWRLPSYLSALTSTTNKALQIIENKIGQKTMATLTEALKTPEGAADLLQTLPGAERNRVLRVLSNPQEWKPGAAAAATVSAKNALAPEQEPQNALAR